MSALRSTRPVASKKSGDLSPHFKIELELALKYCNLKER